MTEWLWQRGHGQVVDRERRWLESPGKAWLFLPRCYNQQSTSIHVFLSVGAVNQTVTAVWACTQDTQEVKMNMAKLQTIWTLAFVYSFWLHLHLLYEDACWKAMSSTSKNKAIKTKCEDLAKEHRPPESLIFNTHMQGLAVSYNKIISSV